MGSCYTYPDSRIAGEVAVFDRQGPAVVDRSALAALHGENTALYPGQGYSKSARQLWCSRLTDLPAWLRVKLANVTCRIPLLSIAPP
jgi:hypothetical protein